MLFIFHGRTVCFQELYGCFAAYYEMSYLNIRLSVVNWMVETDSTSTCHGSGHVTRLIVFLM